MVETPKSSAENLSTPKEAINWTETSQNSKLKEIKGLLDSDSPKIKNLRDLIENKDYVGFQKAIGYKGKLDGKLGQNSLYYTKLYIDKENQADKVSKSTSNELDIFGKMFNDNAEKPDNGIQNISKRRGTRWDPTLQKDVNYEEEVGFTLKGKKLELKHIYILGYENAYEEINDTINDVSITFRGKNIVINNKYVITPEGTMCKYGNKNNIDEWTKNEKETGLRRMVKPLYDYLSKNTKTYEKSYSVTADGTGNHNNHFDNESGSSETREPETKKPADREFTLNEGVAENLEWKKANKFFRNVEVPEFEASSGYWTVSGSMDLNISNIAKEGNTIYLNNGDMKITYNKGSSEIMSLEMRTNRHHIVRWKYLNTEVLKQGSAGEKWELIYKQLNKEYFS